MRPSIHQGASVGDVPLHLSRYSLAGNTRIAERSELIDATRRIADKLESLSIQEDSQVEWQYWHAASGRWNRASTSLDMYSGLPGIALFFAYYGSVFADPRRTSFARRVLDSARRKFNVPLETRNAARAIGAFSGIGGWIYTLCHCAVLWDEPELIGEATSLLDVSRRFIAPSFDRDLISGAAGYLAALAVLNECQPSAASIGLVKTCADILLRQAVEMPVGIAWSSAPLGTQPFAGAGHGAAGIAWALLVAGTLTGERRFSEAGRQALAYESSVFSPERDNWPDFRVARRPPDGGPIREGEPTFPVLWCWGAAGIGIMRLRSLTHCDSDSIMADVSAAIRATLRDGFGRNHCLCHGDLGNADLLVLASEVLREQHWLLEARRVASLTLDSFGRDGWLCGNPWWIETPGLMTGLAGLGYGLLRIAHPELVPSVLGLCPPVFR